MFDRHFHYATAYQGVPSWAETIISLLETIMIDQAALKNAIARLQAKDSEMLATLQGVRDTNKTLAASLADVSAKLAALPQDTTELEATINQAVTDLNAMADQVEAGVAENKAVPDMPPAQPA